MTPLIPAAIETKIATRRPSRGEATVANVGALAPSTIATRLAHGRRRRDAGALGLRGVFFCFCGWGSCGIWLVGRRRRRRGASVPIVGVRRTSSRVLTLAVIGQDRWRLCALRR